MAPRYTRPCLQRDPSCGTIIYLRQWWVKDADRTGTRRNEPDAVLEPHGGTGRKGGAMTPLGRHYHIPSTTVTDPERERVPRAGIPVVKRKRKRERKDLTIKEEDSYLALVPTVCVKGG